MFCGDKGGRSSHRLLGLVGCYGGVRLRWYGTGLRPLAGHRIAMGTFAGLAAVGTEGPEAVELSGGEVVVVLVPGFAAGGAHGAVGGVHAGAMGKIAG